MGEIQYSDNPRAESFQRLGATFTSLKASMPHASTNELLTLTLKRTKAVRQRGSCPWAQWHLAVTEFWSKMLSMYPSRDLDLIGQPHEQREKA